MIFVKSEREIDLMREPCAIVRDTLAAEKNLRIELILVTDDGHVRYTAGLADRF